jgi:hypothetical protein
VEGGGVAAKSWSDRTVKRSFTANRAAEPRGKGLIGVGEGFGFAEGLGCRVGPLLTCGLLTSRMFCAGRLWPLREDLPRDRAG